jgi:hypothetical protein
MSSPSAAAAHLQGIEVPPTFRTITAIGLQHHVVFLAVVDERGDPAPPIMVSSVRADLLRRHAEVGGAGLVDRC